jgi:hypothetical protein
MDAPYYCSGSANCPGGVCCVDATGSAPDTAKCQTGSSCPTTMGIYQVCQPGDVCPMGTTCVDVSMSPVALPVCF